MKTVPDFKLAGSFIQQQILSRFVTRSRFAAQKRFGETTVLRVCDGTYNFPNGLSIDLLWRLAVALSQSQYEAQNLCYRILVECGVVPQLDELTTTAALVQVKVQLELVEKQIIKQRTDNANDQKRRETQSRLRQHREAVLADQERIRNGGMPMPDELPYPDDNDDHASVALGGAAQTDADAKRATGGGRASRKLPIAEKL